MAHFALAVAKVIGSGGAWVIGSKLFGHGLDKSTQQYKKLFARPQNWQQVILNVGTIKQQQQNITLNSFYNLSLLEISVNIQQIITNNTNRRNPICNIKENCIIITKIIILTT